MRFKGITFRRAPAIVWRYPTEEERESDGGGMYVRIGRVCKPTDPGAEPWEGWFYPRNDPKEQVYARHIPLTYSRTNMGWGPDGRVYCVVDGYAYTAPSSRAGAN